MKRVFLLILAAVMIIILIDPVFSETEKTEKENIAETAQKAKDLDLRVMLNRLHDEIAKDANDGVIDNDELLRIIAMTNEFPKAKSEADRYLYIFDAKTTVEIPSALTNLAADYWCMVFYWRDADAYFQKFVFKEVGKFCEIQTVEKNKIFKGILFIMFLSGITTAIAAKKIDFLKKFSKLTGIFIALPVIFIILGLAQKFYLSWITYDKFGNWMW